MTTEISSPEYASSPPPPEGPVFDRPSLADFRDRLRSFLAQHKLVEEAALSRAHRAAEATGERFDHVLTKLGLISEENLTSTLSRFMAIPLASSFPLPKEPILPLSIRPDFVRRNKIIPLALTPETLSVGVTDVLNGEPATALSYLLNRSVDTRLLSPSEFEKAYNAIYTSSVLDEGQSASETDTDTNELDLQRLRDMASEAPIIRLVNHIIAEAVQARASDIHIEPNANNVLIRYRLDGALRIAQEISPNLHAALTSRIKIMSKLDIAERRLPQDGRIKIAVRGNDIDFRVSTVPTVFGESVVMRILDRTRVELDFSKLGFSADYISSFQTLLNQPNGIILVTGPTGSGKTTTLYTALKLLNSPERKIFTVEDPIEYQLAGINQVQVQPSIGLDFPHVLRSVLRQDPDIIMIGEIRDLETARIAIQASLTGHLVLSTLHTNSAAATITRLLDMGIERYLIASTVKGVLAQRLVRKLCPHCSTSHDSSHRWESEIANAVYEHRRPAAPNIRQPNGCEECNQMGFQGRSTISELLIMQKDIQTLVLEGAPDTVIERTAKECGMITMFQDGAEKAWRGETNPEEVVRAALI